VARSLPPHPNLHLSLSLPQPHLIAAHLEVLAVEAGVAHQLVQRTVGVYGVDVCMVWVWVWVCAGEGGKGGGLVTTLLCRLLFTPKPRNAAFVSISPLPNTTQPKPAPTPHTQRAPAAPPQPLTQTPGGCRRSPAAPRAQSAPGTAGCSARRWCSAR